MTFIYPWILLALPALPLLWWLLRVTPPAPRRESFPAIRLLFGLELTEETSARTPWWMLALRMLAAALVIVGLAGPVRGGGHPLPGSGPVLLVLDDGWASAADWSRRVQAADAVLDRAERAGRAAVLLTTAPAEDAAQPRPTPKMPIADLRARLAAARPKPWPVDHAAAATALKDWDESGTAVVYIADGLAEPGDAEFGQTLARIGPITEIREPVPATRVLLPPRTEADRLIARVWQAPHPGPSPAAIVLAQSGDGRTLARVGGQFAPIPGDAAAGLIAEAAITLPPELRNQLTRLVLEGPASAGSVLMLDERWRRRPVGLLAGDVVGEHSPLIGELYYLKRALEPYTEVREGDLKTLLARDLSVLVLADRVIAEGPELEALTKWVEHGGELVRFAGPRTAEHQDPLMAVHMLDGERELGGSLSWSKPAHLAPFPPDSPFVGLPVLAEVTVTRQVLAEPSAKLVSHSWATLSDGTPLVTEASRGAGRIVQFHVTANADWSNLPLSGLFVDMLRRLVALSAGVAQVDGATVLAPATTLDGFGQLGTPPPAATGLAAAAFATTRASPHHPPGLYGPENGRKALNLGAVLPPLRVAAPLRAASETPLGGVAPERELGPPMLALALALIAIDLILSLWLRGLLRWRPVGAAAALLAIALSTPAQAGPAPERSPAVAVHLAYVVTGNDQVDQTSRAGLTGLAEYVNQRTAATLAEPVAITPGKDDLSFYPLLYWPIVADAPTPSAAALAALNDYMAHGGIILIDTLDGGSGADFNPGAESALKKIGAALAIPPLAPLTTDHVLARAFYLLHDFPGRYSGDTVWVQREQDRANDSVSPVIIGGNDWAAAWAVDGNGHNPYAVIPGGARQRTLAYRFGVNLVMYALTGNYKGDQVHVPAILERLGQ